MLLTAPFAARIYQVPAVPDTRVVDVVGCGNACCGAFLAAYSQGAGLAASAAWGCAAGSIMAEHRGVPNEAIRQVRGDAVRRQGEVLKAARRLDIGGVKRGSVVRVEAGMRGRVMMGWRRWGRAGGRVFNLQRHAVAL